MAEEMKTVPESPEFRKQMQDLLRPIEEPERKLAALAYRKMDSCIAQNLKRMKAFIERKTKAGDFETSGEKKLIRGSHKLRSYDFFVYTNADGTVEAENLTAEEAALLNSLYLALRPRLRANPVIADSLYLNAVSDKDKRALEFSIFISPVISEPAPVPPEQASKKGGHKIPLSPVVLHYPEFAQAFLNRFRQLAEQEGIVFDRFRCRMTEQDPATGNDSVCATSYTEDFPVNVPLTAGVNLWDSAAVSIDWTFEF